MSKSADAGIERQQEQAEQHAAEDFRNCHVLILLDDDGTPKRVIGPFIFSDMPEVWTAEHGDIGRHIVLPVEPHGWDE